MMLLDAGSLADALKHYSDAEWGPKSFRAALLHGSQLSETSDSHSDVDLILIVEGAPGNYASAVIGGYDCDLFIVSPTNARSFCALDVRTNNHFVLRSIAAGKIIADSSETLAAIQAEARIRWSNGPSAATREELKQIRLTAIKVRKFFEKCMLRGLTEERWKHIANARAGQFLTQLIDSYYRAAKLWSNSFWLLTSSRDERYAPIELIVNRYLSVDGKWDTCLVIKELALMVEQLVDSKSMQAWVGSRGVWQ